MLRLFGLYMLFPVDNSFPNVQLNLKLEKVLERMDEIGSFQPSGALCTLLGNIILRCVTFVYAEERLCNDVKMYWFCLCCICLTL